MQSRVLVESVFSTSEVDMDPDHRSDLYAHSAGACLDKEERRGRKAQNRMTFPDPPLGIPAVFDVSLRQTSPSTTSFDSKRARMVLKHGFHRVFANVTTVGSLPGCVSDAIRLDRAKAHIISIHAGFVTAPVYIATEVDALTIVCGESFHTVAGIMPPSSRKGRLSLLLGPDDSLFHNITFIEACLLAVFVNLVNRLASSDRPLLVLGSFCTDGVRAAETFAASVTDLLLDLANKAKERWTNKLGSARVQRLEKKAGTSEPLSEDDEGDSVKTRKAIMKKRRRSSEPKSYGAPSRLYHGTSLGADDVGACESTMPSAEENQCLFEDMDATNPPSQPSLLPEHVDMSCRHPQTTLKPQYTMADVENQLLISIFTQGWTASDVVAQVKLWALLYKRPVPVLDHSSFKDVVQSLVQFVRDIEMPYEVASHYAACWEHAGLRKSC